MDPDYMTFNDPFDDPGPGPPQHQATARDWQSGANAEYIQPSQQSRNFIQQFPYPADPAYLSSGVTQPDYNNIYSTDLQALSGPMYPPRSSPVSYSPANSPPNVTFPVDLSQAPPPVSCGHSNSILSPNSQIPSSGRDSSQSPENSVGPWRTLSNKLGRRPNKCPLFSSSTPATSSSSLGAIQPGHNHIYLNPQNDSSRPIFPSYSLPVAQSLESSLPSVAFPSRSLPPPSLSCDNPNIVPISNYRTQFHGASVGGLPPDRVHQARSMNNPRYPKTYYHPYAPSPIPSLNHHGNALYSDIQAPFGTRLAVQNLPGPSNSMVSDATPTLNNPLSWSYSRDYAPHVPSAAATWLGTDMPISSVDYPCTRGRVPQMYSPIIDRDRYQESPELMGSHDCSTQSQPPTIPQDQSSTQVLRPNPDTSTPLILETRLFKESYNVSEVDSSSPEADRSWENTSSSIIRAQFDTGDTYHNLRPSEITLNVRMLDGSPFTEDSRPRGGRRRKRESSRPREDFPPCAQPYYNLHSPGPPLDKEICEAMVVENGGHRQCMFCDWLLSFNQDKIAAHFSAHLGHRPHKCIKCSNYYTRPEDHGSRGHPFEDVYNPIKRAARKPRPR